MDLPQHHHGCVLDPVYWLRHSVAAAGRLIHPLASDPDEALVDRAAAESLMDVVAYFAELDNWAGVTLHDVAVRATLMNDGRFDQMCTCGATA